MSPVWNPVTHKVQSKRTNTYLDAVFSSFASTLSSFCECFQNVAKNNLPQMEIQMHNNMENLVAQNLSSFFTSDSIYFWRNFASRIYLYA